MHSSNHLFSLLSLSLLALTLGGCHSDPDDDHGPIPGPKEHATSTERSPANPPPSRSWSARYWAKCSAEPEKCAGAYGFTVFSDGSYEVGPGPGGEILNGTISKKELETLNEISTRETRVCAHTLPDAPMEHLAFQLGDSENAPNETCDADSVTAVRRLLLKYYPSAFPSPCVSAAVELNKSYAELNHCETAADCTYLDDSFLPVDPRRDTSLSWDRCTLIKPLLVANGFEAVANQLHLLLKREIARRICGASVPRPDCGPVITIHPSAAPPLCVDNVCRPNP